MSAPALSTARQRRRARPAGLPAAPEALLHSRRTGTRGGLHLASARARRIVYAGRVGTGFEAGALGAARELLGRRPVEAPPCTGAVRRGRGHTWVEPRVVCEVRFREQTDDGLLRHPVLVRFRPDRTQGQTRPFSRARSGRG